MAGAKYVDDIPQSRIERMRDAIAGSKGRILLIIHPHFPSQHRPTGGFTRKEAEEYPEYIKRINATMEKSRLPVVALEGWKEAESTERLLRGAGQKALVLPTIEGDPGLRKRGKSEFAPRKNDSSGLIMLLKKLGVKSIVCGGSLSLKKGWPAIPDMKIRAHEKKWLPKGSKRAGREISEGCVGRVYKNLVRSGEFGRIRLAPNICFPHRPKYKRKRAGAAKGRPAQKKPKRRK